jgi:hypothetical protein
MSQVDIDMGAFAGLNVRVRFRLACDELLAGSLPGVGWWIDDVQFTNTVVEGPCPTVVSRKTHGSSGDFDIALPLAGTPGIECRSGGPSTGNHTLIYTLDRNLVVPGTATVAVSPSGSGTATAGPAANQVTVNLTGIPNAQHVLVTLNGVQDSAGASLNNLVVRMDVLLGDVDGTGRVDGNDVSAVQSHTRQTTASGNYRYDVDVSSRIDGNDVSATQAQTRTGLPPSSP